MKKVLITGASRGIGEQIAYAIAPHATELILHGRDTKRLNHVAGALRERSPQTSTQTAVIDLADHARIEQALSTPLFAGVDTIIHNAAIALAKRVEETSPEEWNRLFAVNVTAPFLITRALLPALQSGASIVHILSVAARTGFPGWSAYSMSKFALEGFTQSLREEVRKRGIRVISVYPGAVDTDIWEGIPGDWPRERMLPPVAVAQAVVHVLTQPPGVLVDSISIGDVRGSL